MSREGGCVHRTIVQIILSSHPYRHIYERDNSAPHRSNATLTLPINTPQQSCSVLCCATSSIVYSRIPPKRLTPPMSAAEFMSLTQSYQNDSIFVVRMASAWHTTARKMLPVITNGLRLLAPCRICMMVQTICDVPLAQIPSSEPPSPSPLMVRYQRPCVQMCLWSGSFAGDATLCRPKLVL